MKKSHNSKVPLGENQRLNERLKKIKTSTFDNRRMNENGNDKTSFRDTLMKGVSDPKTLGSRLEDIDNEEMCSERKASLHSSDGESNSDTLLTNLDGGFTIVKNRRRKQRQRVNLSMRLKDKNSQTQTKNKHYWLYARAMMLSKFQKAAGIYKSNPARARMLADEESNTALWHCSIELRRLTGYFMKITVNY